MERGLGAHPNPLILCKSLCRTEEHGRQRRSKKSCVPTALGRAVGGSSLYSHAIFNGIWFSHPLGRRGDLSCLVVDSLFLVHSDWVSFNFLLEERSYRSVVEWPNCF